MSKRGCVVVVDDDIAMSELWRAMLGSTGVAIECLPGPEGVEQAIAQIKPDLVILDYLMPVRNGVEVLESLQATEETRQIPVWMVSTESQSELIAAAYKLGVLDYVVKPFDPPAMQAKVLAFLDRTRSATVESSARARELRRAKDQVQGMFGSVPKIDGLDIGVVYEPYDEVGGDFYDFIEGPDGRQFLVIGDISGHGVEAALLQTMTRKLVQMHLRDALDPRLAFRQINVDIAEAFPRGKFSALAVIETSGGPGEFSLYRFGTPHPILCQGVGAGRTHQVVLGGGALLGVFPDRAFEQFTRPTPIRLQPGDCLLLHTDGAVEAKLEGGNELGFQRLGEIIEKAAGGTAQQKTIDIASRAKATSSNGLDDDLTLLLVVAN